MRSLTRASLKKGPRCVVLKPCFLQLKIRRLHHENLLQAFPLLFHVKFRLILGTSPFFYVNYIHVPPTRGPVTWESAFQANCNLL